MVAFRASASLLFILAAVALSQNVGAMPPTSPPQENDPTCPTSRALKPGEQQEQYDVYYSTKGMLSVQHGTKGKEEGLTKFACGIFIQNDPIKKSGIQLEVAPAGKDNSTLVLTQRDAPAPYGAVARRYMSDMILKTDLDEAICRVHQEPIQQVPDESRMMTKYSCINWSMSTADDLHVRGLIRNTQMQKGFKFDVSPGPIAPLCRRSCGIALRSSNLRARNLITRLEGASEI